MKDGVGVESVARSLVGVAPDQAVARDQARVFGVCVLAAHAIGPALLVHVANQEKDNDTQRCVQARWSATAAVGDESAFDGQHSAGAAVDAAIFWSIGPRSRHPECAFRKSFAVEPRRPGARPWNEMSLAVSRRCNAHLTLSNGRSRWAASCAALAGPDSKATRMARPVESRTASTNAPTCGGSFGLSGPTSGINRPQAPTRRRLGRGGP